MGQAAPTKMEDVVKERPPEQKYTGNGKERTHDVENVQEDGILFRAMVSYAFRNCPVFLWTLFARQTYLRPSRRAI